MLEFGSPAGPNSKTDQNRVSCVLVGDALLISASAERVIIVILDISKLATIKKSLVAVLSRVCRACCFDLPNLPRPVFNGA